MRVVSKFRSLIQPVSSRLWLPAAFLLVGCATQPPSGTGAGPAEPATQAQHFESAEHSALRSLTNAQERLYRVTGPILVSNSELCKSSARNLLGFTAKNKYSYSIELASAAEELLGLNDQLQVMGVLPGSGAAKAGVRRGDKLLTVEGTAIPTGLNAERQAAAILRPLMGKRSAVKLNVMRDGSTLALTVPLTHACAFGVELGNADHVNAYNDGQRVMITRGMMNFVLSDTELAYILAKELAHNSLRHASKQTITGTVNAVIENLVRIEPDLSTMAGSAGIKPMPPELDAEADRLALYMLARAGYSIDEALQFWKRLATQYPVSVSNAYTAIHPGTHLRLAAIEKTVAEIKKKQAINRPLLP